MTKRKCAFLFYMSMSLFVPWQGCVKSPNPNSLIINTNPNKEIASKTRKKNMPNLNIESQTSKAYSLLY